MNIAYFLRTCCLPAVYDATCWSDVRAALRALKNDADFRDGIDMTGDVGNQGFL